MAGVPTVAASSAAVCRRLLAVERSLPATKYLPSSTSSSKCYSIGGWNPLRRRTAVLPSRKLVIRAARVESEGVSLGFRPPEFELPEPLTGKVWKLDDFDSYPALLVMFICNHCPFVKHLKHDIVKLSNFYMKKGLAVVAISSNSVTTHPQDGPDFMAEDAKIFKYPFPYLYDEDGRRPFELVYHGQFDDSRPSNNMRITGRDLSLAIDNVLSGQPVSSVQKPRPSSCNFFITSVGCSIKWKPEG
ncbi:hypothetical protein SASPL_150031 [Salvia splendens]|uniref:glutaredoxin-dependent peroxiredoxin n=1 Tax=Salvia splendens TaxID=180675 RepID=A0A8X8W6H3_SALSN|nr:hypothetical protein SASPL_150031 [Salvia splendens]